MPDVELASFVRETFLHADDRAVALVDPRGELTYGDLRARVAERSAAVGLARRSVVVVEASDDRDFVVDYLALLDAGHVPLLAGGQLDRLVDTWRPAAVRRAGSTSLEHHRDEWRELHPDLRLLMSTSGSTGSPKLVRLSDRNLASNARAIGEILRLTQDDRGITSLPLHYCYGLSVLHAHLAAGASMVLTEASVVDPCFTDAVRDLDVTNLAGVPHTFELLERAGPERVRGPRMRLLTQAGGRLAPDAVERWVERTDAWGAEFVVMYGQTEATARMAYLAPVRARRRPGAIGVAIPGGTLEVCGLEDAGSPVPPGHVGELVYRGPNVMLGYAHVDDDLADGATIDELHTGDLARFHADDGVFEIVGRRSRFVKPFGLRVDLDELERLLGRSWPEVAVAGDDDRIVAVAPGAEPGEVGRELARAGGLPVGFVTVVDAPVPRTESGKVDHGAILELADAATAHWTWRSGAEPSEVGAGAAGARVAGVYATVLGRTDVQPTSTFVSLGGDSLSYVECSVRLEAVLGRLPSDWHLLSVAELERAARPVRVARLDTTVVLRAVGILAVVATHMHLVFVPGGAHLLLAVVGFNLSRFQIPIESTVERLRAGMRTAARVAVPTMLWVTAGMLLAGSYTTGTLLLVNNYVGPASHRDDHWHFWFIEVFVHLVVVTMLLLAIPGVRRVERRYPYGFPLALFLVSLTWRMEWAQLDDWYNLRYRTHGVAWFFFLGWLVHRSRTPLQRGMTSVLCVLTIPGFFDLPQREWMIAAGLVVLVWCRDVPLPRVAVRPVATVAAASMWILVTHFTVWPPLDDAFDRRFAYVLTILVGIGASLAADRVARVVRRQVPTTRKATSSSRSRVVTAASSSPSASSACP